MATLFNNLFKTIQRFQKWTLKRHTGVMIIDQILLIVIVAAWLAAGYFALRFIAFAGYVGFGTIHNIMNLTASFWIFTILGLVLLGFVMRRSVLKKWAAENAADQSGDLEQRLDLAVKLPIQPTGRSGGNGAQTVRSNESGNGSGETVVSRRPVSGTQLTARQGQPPANAKPGSGTPANGTGTGVKPGAVAKPPVPATGGKPGSRPATSSSAAGAQSATGGKPQTPIRRKGDAPSLLTRFGSGGATDTQPKVPPFVSGDDDQ